MRTFDRKKRNDRKKMRGIISSIFLACIVLVLFFVVGWIDGTTAAIEAQYL